MILLISISINLDKPYIINPAINNIPVEIMPESSILVSVPVLERPKSNILIIKVIGIVVSIVSGIIFAIILEKTNMPSAKNTITASAIMIIIVLDIKDNYLSKD